MSSNTSSARPGADKGAREAPSTASKRPAGASPANAGPMWPLWVAFVLCLVYPLDDYMAGGRVHPALLRRDLSSQTIVITGANTGIGFETALQLARQRAEIALLCRSASKCADAVTRIRAQVPDARVAAHVCDLSLMADVKRTAAELLQRYPKITQLINNAGVMLAPRAMTSEGHEATWASNHLGHFLLAHELLPRLQESAPSRVIILSSRAHVTSDTWDFNALESEPPLNSTFITYGRTKLSNILHARALARRVAGAGVTVVSAHPGSVLTPLWRHIPLVGGLEQYLAPLLLIGFKSPWEGAQTTLHTALADDVPQHNGEYFADCEVAPRNVRTPASYDDDLAEKLYVSTARLLHLPA